MKFNSQMQNETPKKCVYKFPTYEMTTSAAVCSKEELLLTALKKLQGIDTSAPCAITLAV